MRSASFQDLDIRDTRDRIAARMKKVADDASKKVDTKEKAPRTKKGNANEEDRKLTRLLDRALHDCADDDLDEMLEATTAH